MFDLTKQVEIVPVSESVAFFVDVSTGARGTRMADVSWTFKKVAFTKLYFVPIGDILAWQEHLKNVTSYMVGRAVQNVEFWEMGRDLMDGLRAPLAKALTRNRWSRIVALYTYQELQNRFREVITDERATGEMAEAQRAWEEEWGRFSGLEGAIPRGELLPRTLAEAVAEFYARDAQERLPAACALFLFMRAINPNPLYAEYLAGRDELAVYRLVLSGKRDIDAGDDLAVEYVRNLRKGQAPSTTPLPPQPDPRSGKRSWLFAGAVFVLLGGGFLAVLTVLVGVLLYYNAVS